MARQWFAGDAQWHEDGTESWFAAGTQLVEDQASGGSPQTLEPPALASTASLHAPTVAPGPVTLSAPQLASTATLHGPTVAAGVVSLAPPAIASASALHAPTVAAGGVSVSPPLLGSTAALFAPTVAGGTLLVVPHLGPGSATHAPTVAAGGVTLDAPLLAPSATLHPPIVSTGGFVVGPPTIGPGAALFGPSVAPGPVGVDPPAIGSTASLHVPRVGLWVAVPGIAAGSVVYAPTVGQGAAGLVVPRIGPGAVLHEPTVSGGSVLVRDDIVLLRMRDALIARQVFTDVILPTDRDDFSAESRTPPFAAIWQPEDRGDANDEIFESNSDGTYTLRHQLEFNVAIIARDNSQEKRGHDVKRLIAITRNTLRDNSLGGLIEGDLTDLGPGRLQTIKVSNVDSPDARYDFTGVASYFVNSATGYDETDYYAPEGFDPDAEPPPSDGPAEGVGGLLFAVAAGPYTLTDGTAVAFPGGVATVANTGDTHVWIEADGTLATDADA